MYKLILSVSATREIKTLKKRYQDAIIEALEDIRQEPTLGKSLTRGLTGKFAYRVGLYRIIYKINTRDKTVIVISAGHRATIYN